MKIDDETALMPAERGDENDCARPQPRCSRKGFWNFPRNVWAVAHVLKGINAAVGRHTASMVALPQHKINGSSCCRDPAAPAAAMCCRNSSKGSLPPCYCNESIGSGLKTDDALVPPCTGDGATIPKLIVDLTLRPSVRWDSAIRAIVGAYGWRRSYGLVFDQWWIPHVDGFDPRISSLLVKRVQKELPEVWEEILGAVSTFASLGQSQVQAKHLAAAQWQEGLAHVGIQPRNAPLECASVLAWNQDSEAILMGRNLDSRALFRNISGLVEWTNGSAGVVMRSTQWTGFDFGVTTAVAGGKAGFSMDSRVDCPGCIYSAQTFYDRIRNDTRVIGVSQTARRALLRGSNYSAVLAELLAAQTVVSDYWIVGGTKRGEGAIIAHSHNATAKVFTLGTPGEVGTGGVPTGQKWYAVETNWEFWKTPGGAAYPHDPRRADIMQTFNELGQAKGASAQGICQALSGPQVLNSGTVFTAVWAVESGEMKVALRDPQPRITSMKSDDDYGRPTMQRVPAGTVTMGSSADKPLPGSLGLPGRPSGDYDEHPQRSVWLAEFVISATEVTNAQYEQYDPAHRTLRGLHGWSRKDDEAVVFVSYENATRYCQWLQQTSQHNRSYRLPTEIEWESAARAGSTSNFWYGDTFNTSESKGNTKDLSPHRAVHDLTVGIFRANPLGLFDVHGNVEEWTASPYEYTGSSPTEQPLTGLWSTRSGR